MQIPLSVYNLIIFFSSWGIMSHGFILVLMTKNKLKGVTVGENEKKRLFFRGVIFLGIGFLLFQFILVTGILGIPVIRCTMCGCW